MAEPVSLRRRTVVTCVYAFLFVGYTFTLSFKPQWAAYITVPPIAFAGLFVLFGLPVMTLANFLRLYQLWKIHSYRALIPLGICIFALVMNGPIGHAGMSLRIRGFKANLPQYEAMVADIRDRSNSVKPTGIECVGEDTDILKVRIPEKLRHLAYSGNAKFDAEGNLEARFYISVAMNFHHRAYLYVSDGDASRVLRPKEFINRPITEHWYAIGD